MESVPYTLTALLNALCVIMTWETVQKATAPALPTAHYCL
jgi:hypothetical protein